MGTGFLNKPIALAFCAALALASCNLSSSAPVITPVVAVEQPTLQQSAATLSTETPALSQATEPPTQMPTDSIPADWQTYTDQAYGFEFRYPPTGQILSRQDHAARISLLIAPGTNLAEKFIDVSAMENVRPCASPNPGASQSKEVSVNNIPFLEERGADAGAGQIYEWTAYSAQENNVCVSLTFVLHSTNRDNYPTPPPLFDATAEADIFAPILASFEWLNP